jgi:hypothetical protein
MLDLLRNGLGWTEAAKGASALQYIEVLYNATIKCLPQEVPAHQANYIALMELSGSAAKEYRAKDILSSIFVAAQAYLTPFAPAAPAVHAAHTPIAAGPLDKNEATRRLFMAKVTRRYSESDKWPLIERFCQAMTPVMNSGDEEKPHYFVHREKGECRWCDGGKVHKVTSPTELDNMWSVIHTRFIKRAAKGTASV